VDDDGAAQHALRADQLDELVRDAALGVTLAVGLEVAEVADVALAVGGGAVGLVVGVDCGWGMEMSICLLWFVGRETWQACHQEEEVRLTVRTGAGAAVGVVAESVDVHATLGVGVVAGHVPGDLGVGRLGGLLEGDGALDVGVTTDDGDYLVELARCIGASVLTVPPSCYLVSMLDEDVHPVLLSCKHARRRQTSIHISTHERHTTPRVSFA